MAGDTRQLSQSQFRNLPREVQDGLRTVVEQFAEWVDEINDRIDRLTGETGEIPQFDSDGGLVSSSKTAPTGDIVGTSDQQTLTQKTLTTPTVTNPTVTTGTFASPTITSPTITGGTLTAPTISDANLADPDFSSEDGSFEYSADTADTDLTLSFVGTTKTGQYSWMEDEDYFLFADDIAITGGENIILSATTGTQIGTANTQLLGLWGTTPCDQPASVSDAVTTANLDGADTINKAQVIADLANLKTAVNAILARLREPGFIDT